MQAELPGSGLNFPRSHFSHSGLPRPENKPAEQVEQFVDSALPCVDSPTSHFQQVGEPSDDAYRPASHIVQFWAFSGEERPATQFVQTTSLVFAILPAKHPSHVVAAEV